MICENDENSWNNLLIFPYATLRLRDKNENVQNLTSFVRQNIKSWNENNINIIPNIKTHRDNKKIGNEIFKKVEAKLSDGDISGSLRLISSDDCIAPKNEATLNSLREKHPPHPQPEPNLNVQNGEAKNNLIAALTSLAGIILSGKVPTSTCPYLYGATLTALQKLCGGIRPIAVRNVWRRIAAKLVCRRVSSVLYNLFRQNQLGVGIKNGAEADAHASRIYFNTKHESIKIFLKIDVKNAFNEIRRDSMLEEVKRNVPEIFKFVERTFITVKISFFHVEGFNLVQRYSVKQFRK